CERFEGAWLEDKNLAFALHYRAVKPELQAAFGAGVRRRVRPHQSRVVLVHGKRVFEVTPAVQRDKSVALVDWLARQRPEMSSFYFGDDTNDEPVFDRVKDRGGVTVAVGRLASHAEYGVGSTEEVVWFLEWLEREWSLRGGAGPAGRRWGSGPRAESPGAQDRARALVRGGARGPDRGGRGGGAHRGRAPRSARAVDRDALEQRHRAGRPLSRAGLGARAPG